MSTTLPGLLGQLPDGWGVIMIQGKQVDHSPRSSKGTHCLTGLQKSLMWSVLKTGSCSSSSSSSSVHREGCACVDAFVWRCMLAAAVELKLACSSASLQ